jgi:hypothetical protein
MGGIGRPHVPHAGAFISTAAPQYGHGLVGVAIRDSPVLSGSNRNPHVEVKATNGPRFGGSYVITRRVAPHGVAVQTFMSFSTRCGDVVISCALAS